MKKKILSLLLLPSLLFAQPHIVGRLQGQLGNQLFIVAATVSLALDNQAEALFPDFALDPNVDGRKTNYRMIFSSLNTSSLSSRPRFIYQEPHFHYCPIPYHPDMEIKGYFQSEKYFKNHEQEMRQLFAPSKEINEELEKRYHDLLDHPQTVAVHVRSYIRIARPSILPTLSHKYYQKAFSRFPSNTRFIVFSNDIHHAKRILSFYKGEIIFIENQSYIYDFYLMSKCKHQIISNSSFAWWSAYLNNNPEKRIIAPRPWFGSGQPYKFEDLIPKSWEVVDL